MAALVPLETQFAIALTAVTAIALLLGHVLVLPDVPVSLTVRRFFTTDWKYLGVAWATTMVINQAATYRVEGSFTGVIYQVEGDLVAVFQTVTTPALTVAFAFVYLVGFPVVVLLTYVVLRHADEAEAIRYALAYLLLVVLAAPFFVLLPVRITSATLHDVEPLLYDIHPVVLAGMMATDTLMKAFPSLHAGLSILATLYARHAGRPRYVWGVAVTTMLIVMSTWYLGIHWVTDAVVAVPLVAVAYAVSRRAPLPRWHVPRPGFVSSWL